MFAWLNLIVDNWLTRLDVEVDHNGRRPLGAMELDAYLVAGREIYRAQRSFGGAKL